MYVLWPLCSLMILIIINSLTLIVDEDLTLQYFPSKVSLLALVFLLIYCCSIPQLYPSLCYPMACNMPGFHVVQHLPELAQTHVHWVSNFIRPSFCSDLEPKKIKSVTVSIVSPSVCLELLGPDAKIFIFWMLNFKPAFSFSPFTSSRGSLVLLCFLP